MMIRNKLRQMNDRFNKLDDEYRLYKDSTDHIEHEKERALSACRRTEQEYENEINNLKDKLKGTKVSLEHLNQLNMDKTKVGNENAELSKQLKKKEAYIGQLKALLLLRSNSNEENGDENNEDCVGPLECNSKRKSVKGNKIGSLCSSTDKLSSRYSSSNSSGFGGSHSQEHLSSPTVGDRQINMTNSQTSTSSAGVDPIQTLPPRIQRMIRDSNEVGKKLRMLSKSIAEVSTNFVEGKDPEFHLLASRFSDSSESDEDYNETSATFTKTQFEHLLRKHQEDLSKAERFLGTLTGNVLHFTTRQATDHQQQPSCSIQ
uniref:Uncharacterized protein n=1 Tax=Rhabditophanes sp. KR3021 TaxID=114890 RepID=A0AC35TGS8_9BILA